MLSIRSCDVELVVTDRYYLCCIVRFGFRRNPRKGTRVPLVTEIIKSIELQTQRPSNRDGDR
jgi:hypothetical protein